jgi:hypothetical protein
MLLWVGGEPNSKNMQKRGFARARTGDLLGDTDMLARNHDQLDHETVACDEFEPQKDHIHALFVHSLTPSDVSRSLRPQTSLA